MKMLEWYSVLITAGFFAMLFLWGDAMFHIKRLRKRRNYWERRFLEVKRMYKILRSYRDVDGEEWKRNL